MTEEQIKALQSTGGEALAATEKNILGNHMPRLWEIVRDLKTKRGTRVDFVLDNAGFELYCDCVYGMSGSFPPTRLDNDEAKSRLPHSGRICGPD